MVKNDFGIKNITIESTAKCYCPLGNDWYTNQFTVDFIPGEFIPDYCELDNWIAANINGKTMIIEDAVASLHKHLESTYFPAGLRVKSYVNDARHSTVTVCKE